MEETVGLVSTCGRELLRRWWRPICLMVSFYIFTASVRNNLDRPSYVLLCFSLWRFAYSLRVQGVTVAPEHAWWHTHARTPHTHARAHTHKHTNTQSRTSLDPCPVQITIFTRDKHSCRRKVSNLQSLQVSGHRPTPYTVWPPGYAKYDLSEDN
jgi:hypothetical protein